MDSTFQFAVNIAITLVIYSILGILLSGTKAFKYAKKCALMVVIIIILNFISEFDFSFTEKFELNQYKVDETEIWSNALKHVEDEFESQIMLMCASNGLNISTCRVTLKNSDENVAIESIYLTGKDKNVAKELISGYFGVSSAYINTDGEQ